MVNNMTPPPLNTLLGQDFADYREIRAYNQSFLKQVLKTPYFYANNLPYPKIESASVSLGSYLHDVFLTPNDIIYKYSFEELNLRTNAGKERRDELVAMGLTLIPETMRQQAAAIKEAAQPHIARYVKDMSRCENSYFALMDFGDFGNQLAKAKFDYIAEDGVIYDLKFVQDSSPRGFLKAVLDYGYDFQAFFYTTITGDCDPKRFKFIAISTNEPHFVGVYTLDPLFFDKARRDFAKVCDILAHPQNYAGNLYKGIDGGDEITLECPSWAF